MKLYSFGNESKKETWKDHGPHATDYSATTSRCED